jgi:proteasome alpha subunit
MYPASSAYDRAITVFSPDGRLFQVEYAREAVKRGTTALGILYKNGGLLATDKSAGSRLVNAESIEKIFKIDDHIACATSGLVADARRIVHMARLEAQREKVAYNEPVQTDALVREICDMKQMYTQYGGTRPFGTSLLVLGVNERPSLFETDPSGAFSEIFAGAIGAGKKDVESVFEKEYDPASSFEDAVRLAVKVLKEVGDKSTTLATLEVVNIDTADRMYRKLSVDELKKISEGEKKGK